MEPHIRRAASNRRRACNERPGSGELGHDLDGVPVGQVVGQMNSVEKVSAVIQRLVEEYLEAVDRLNALQPAEV